ncbi:unnamed protein product, partial [Tetraodon nigroviridis]
NGLPPRHQTCHRELHLHHGRRSFPPCE